MKLFIDTETTGKAIFSASPQYKFQPRIVQLAAILTADNGYEAASFCFVIRPDGFEIPADAAAIHGITQDFAAKNGVASGMAIKLLCGFAKEADLCVAHNSDFDRLMVAIESDRTVCPLPKRDWFCTMKATTPICKLPGKYDDYKWPKLQEAYTHIFKAPFEGAHDALADVRACKRIYFWLKEQEKPAINPAPPSEDETIDNIP